MKLIKKFLRSAKSKGGYTLIEIAAVVAITATLGAVVVPIAVDKANEGKLAAAKEDVKSIGGAISAFYKDVGYFPGDALNMKLPGVTSDIPLLYSGDDTHIPTAVATTAGWPASGDHLDNWLVKDNPNGVAEQFIPTSGGKMNWKGPYSESFSKKDPWGNDYVVFAQAMYYATTDASNATLATAPTGVTSPGAGTKQYGWILSAGPNAKLDTDVDDEMTKGDDIGSPLYSAEAAH